MGQYICEVQATSNTSANTQDTFVELKAPAGCSLLIKRVRISCATANSDVDITATLYLNTGAGANGTAGTINKKRQGAPTSGVGAGCQVKNTTTAFSVGAGQNKIDEVNINGRAIWEWIPRGNEEFIDTVIAGYFAVAIAVSSASIKLDVTVEWEE